MPSANRHYVPVKGGSCDEVRWKSDQFGKGIDAMYCIKDGKATLRSIWFDKALFSPDKARSWLTAHNYSTRGFQVATG